MTPRPTKRGVDERRAWDGAIVLGLGYALYLGRVHDTSPHAHHASQICVALERPFRLRRAAGGSWREYEAAVIRADAPHQLDGRGGSHLLVYVEPETPDGMGMAPPEGTAIRSLAPDLARRIRERLAGAEPPGTGTTASAHLWPIVADSLDLRGFELRPLDPRIVATLARLRVQPADPTTASDLAAAVGLSPSRFRHLFVQEVGTTYRRFVLWLRLYAAMRRLGDARTLTEAAHDAGFADSAHLSRSFRRMFGIAPSAVGRNVRLAVSDASRDSRELVAPVRV